VFTWIICSYAILTEKIRVLQIGYHILAVIALDAFLLIMWFAETVCSVSVMPDRGRYARDQLEAHAPVAALGLLQW
jgi:hypothetical protein